MLAFPVNRLDVRRLQTTDVHDSCSVGGIGKLRASAQSSNSNVFHGCYKEQAVGATELHGTVLQL